jgi:polysaccharide pyruvyl transferase WcaK-like protein
VGDATGPPVNILLINNHSLRNAGDHAILAETLRLLEQRFPAARVGLVFNDTASARAALPGYPIYASPLTWAAPLGADGNYRFVARWRRLLYLALLLAWALCRRLAGWAPPPFACRSKRALLRAFAEADLVLACGGGYIYAAGPGDDLSGWFGFMLAGCALALLLNKPLALLPQSIGPLHDQFQRRATRWVVRGARLTCVRERRSLDLLRQLGCDARAVHMPDMAFGAPSGPVEPARALLDRAGAPIAPAFRVGMTVLNWSGQNFTFTGQQRYEDAVLGLIDAIAAQGGMVALFAQCRGPSAAEDDRLVGARLRARAACPDRVLLLDDELPPDALQAAYGQMDYFVGTRMHSVILALNAGVPALAIGYLHKTSGVLGELGLAEYCYDIATLTAEELIAGFERLRAASSPGGAPSRAGSGGGRAPLPPDVGEGAGGWGAKDAYPDVGPYLERARRAKRALAQLLWMIAGER